MAKNPWEKLSSKILLENPWFKVRKDSVVRPTGEKADYFVIDSGPSVMIVPITEKNEVYLVGLYRYPTDMYSWEIPGGKVNEESPIEAGRRELKEETGLEAEDWKELGIQQGESNNTSTILHVLLARNVRETGSHEQEEEGITQMKKVPFGEVMGMIKRGEITDSISIGALTLAGLRLGLIK